jgi:hypothetical protein
MEYSTVLKLSDKQLNYALFGLIYGDGHYSKGWIHINHSKQKFYVEMIERFCIANGLQYTVRYDVEKASNLGDYIVDTISIKVKQRRHFEKFGRIYNSVTGKRQSSNYVLGRISILGLLFWYLDDGCLVVHKKANRNAISRFIYLNTHAFSFVWFLYFLRRNGMRESRFSVNNIKKSLKRIFVTVINLFIEKPFILFLKEN